MMGSRRAGAAGASPAAATAIKTTIAALAGALGLSLAMLGTVSMRVARKVVTPAGRVPDTRLLAVDVAAQTVTLSRTDDTQLPGRYGLFTTGTAAYLKLGAVLSLDAASVKRKLLTEISVDDRLSAEAAFSGWYYTTPEELHLPFRAELVGSPLGPCPAWFFPAETAADEPSDTWVIQVHGRGTTRAEALRAVPVFHAAGISSLLVSYRNDGEAPRSRSGTYMLGATEWRDVDAAIGAARRRGAQRVFIMGWSMGGAIALQLALGSAHRDLIAGIILESPAIDWRVVLDHQAQLLRIPGPVATTAVRALDSGWGSRLVGLSTPIPFDTLDVVARAAELRHPILILHSDDDGFVPADASYELAEARPDLVELEVFQVARHTKLWNYDPDRWTRVIRDWVDRQRAGADS
ncbi:alpha/beta hydrolase family protein [Microbacterium oleivorans]|uniref:Alpha/beta fold hydrolase n=1 Tax=Microbacterium oleivorans TaxID=273677 RepID=A0A7D5EY64_9MICO|nr:alpha/beta fold hydrolase [Microbacterium oleivorans]QLD13006.1 alpha/beta fold hydrolase [Microbacterium oleivorans]